MKEGSKAARRRYVEDKIGLFNWKTVFRGNGIDVGSGDDLYPAANVRGFDKEDGDANDLTTYFEPGAFSFLHASQCLEHMINPAAALASWIAVVKPGGHLVITIPDFVLYEQGHWPSQFNPDHKSTWSMTLRGSPAGAHHVYVPDFLNKFERSAAVKRAGTICTNYDFAQMFGNTDQTYPEDRGVEAFIEFVLQKRR